ncbi:MAG: carbonic anhydrase [Chloroflexota bacterium]
MTQPEATQIPAELEVFVSQSLWHQDNEHVLVVACPDPRFREARGEFIDARYGLRRYDPLIIPGGPLAVLSTTPNSGFVRDMITLLDNSHGFERIIGISHHDCRAYREAYPDLPEPARRVHQMEDLRAFTAEMHSLVPNIEVEAFYSEPSGRHLRFVRVR